MEREKENKGILISDHLYEHVLEISANMYLIQNQTTYKVDSKEELQSLGYL